MVRRYSLPPMLFAGISRQISTWIVTFVLPSRDLLFADASRCLALPQILQISCAQSTFISISYLGLLRTLKTIFCLQLPNRQWRRSAPDSAAFNHARVTWTHLLLLQLYFQPARHHFSQTPLTIKAVTIHSVVQFTIALCNCRDSPDSIQKLTGHQI